MPVIDGFETNLFALLDPQKRQFFSFQQNFDTFSVHTIFSALTSGYPFTYVHVPYSIDFCINSRKFPKWLSNFEKFGENFETDFGRIQSAFLF